MHDHHHHHHGQRGGDGPLTAAVAVNVILTLAQVIGGVVAGSLSLIADALHNLSDATSLAIALFARRVGRRPANVLKTFGGRGGLDGQFIGPLAIAADICIYTNSAIVIEEI